MIGQKQLDQFRDEMSTKVNDAYTVLLREKKLPLQLLEDPDKKLGGKLVSRPQHASMHDDDAHACRETLILLSVLSLCSCMHVVCVSVVHCLTGSQCQKRPS